MRIHSILFSICFVFTLCFPQVVFAQYKDDSVANKTLQDFEKKIDEAVVAADIAFLQHAYADDFHFKHGTGLIDDKASWLASVAKNKGVYISRIQDSVEVEIHQNIGITSGHLTVVRKDRTYNLKYVRVYSNTTGQWQMVMHRTVQETDN